MSKEINESEELLRDYLANNQIIIVDSVSSSRVSLTTQLCKMGASRQKMALVSSLEEARAEIDRMKAKIVFADFLIGNQSSLDLIQDQKQKFEQEKVKDTLFVLVTGNASQSTVARAAEEDVDTFVIKPYTQDVLKKALAESIAVKLKPTQYMQVIEEGKEQLFANQLEQALETFSKAMSLHPQPTLACFYHGQVQMMKAVIGDAEKKFEQGLSYNKIHYKCLVGLYELLAKQNKHHEAYDVVKRLAQYFPANPKRLASVLRLAIITENFQDMEGYYRIFLKLDHKTDELVRYMCSALVVTGKYYLKQKIRTRAVEVFNNAAISAGPQSNFLLYIIENLVEHKMVGETKSFIARLRENPKNAQDVKIAEFLIATLTEKPEMIIHKGRQLVQDGVANAGVYVKLIEAAVRAGKDDIAEEYKALALARWPNFTKKFEIKRVA